MYTAELWNECPGFFFVCLFLESMHQMLIFFFNWEGVAFNNLVLFGEDASCKTEAYNAII